MQPPATVTLLEEHHFTEPPGEHLRALWPATAPFLAAHEGHAGWVLDVIARADTPRRRSGDAARFWLPHAPAADGYNDDRRNDGPLLAALAAWSGLSAQDYGDRWFLVTDPEGVWIPADLLGSCWETLAESLSLSDERPPHRFGPSG